jgi:hypothetical protein
VEEQKFTIWKSRDALKEGVLYIIVAGGFYNRNIYAEGHVLVIRPGQEPVLFHLEPTHFPKDVGFELASLLKAQFEFGRDQLAKWLSDQTGYQAYAQIRQIHWEPMNDIEHLALLLRSDKKVLEKFDEILADSNCIELEKFLGKARIWAGISTIAPWL